MGKINSLNLFELDELILSHISHENHNIYNDSFFLKIQ
jgi:hypothetical protein